ncbi:unnamed protein product, partial [Trypanosoma congolense IL3000]
MSVDAKIKGRAGVKLSQPKAVADGWEEEMKKEEKIGRLHRDGALDLSWIWETYDAFVEIAEKVKELLKNPEGKAGKGDLKELEKKLKDGQEKWPEYYEMKKNYWRRRLEVVEQGGETDAVEKDLKVQEEEADRLEKELETIEEALAEILAEKTAPKTDAEPDPVLRELTCDVCGKKYVSFKWLKKHVEGQHPGKKE